MKNQYVGDIGDYGKYGLLRHFAKHGIKIGINWYLTADDGSSDGRFTGYLKNPEDRYFDPELYDALRKLAFLKDKTVEMVESEGLVPGAVFYSSMLKISSLEAPARKLSRQLWFNNSTLLLGDADLIFADPDNGISYRKSPGNKDNEKFALPQEIADYYNRGKNVVCYCHKGRRREEEWEQAKTGIRKYVRDAQILAVTSHRGTQRTYIFIVHPDCYRRYEQLLTSFLSSVWGNMFTREPVSGNVSSPSACLKEAGYIPLNITLEPLCLPFSVCRVADYSGLDIDQPFVFTGRTDHEKSLVCPTEIVPANTLAREDGWMAFRICGELDFSLTGILAGISRILTDHQIGIFAVSTYNTDYVLTKEENFGLALQVLRDSGYRISGNTNE